jgi:hypothetical protein
MSIFHNSDPQVHRALESVWERVREVYEHYPQRLTAFVNGAEVASQDVGSVRTRQNIKLNSDLKPEIIEVFSEQGLCLLTMHVDAMPPSAPPDIRQQVELSQGRNLETCLHFTSVGIYLEVIYHDPSRSIDPEAEGEISAEEKRKEQESPFTSAKDATFIQPSFRQPWLQRLWSPIPKIGTPKMAWGLAGAFVLLVTSVLVSGIFYRHPTKLNAKELLDKSEAANIEGRKGLSSGVICQTVEIRTSGGVLQRRIYRDAQRRRLRKPEKSTAEEVRLQNLFTQVGLDWEEPLSAGSYLDWRGKQEVRDDDVQHSQGKVFLLTTEAPQGMVSRETLAIRESDLHPVKRTVELRSGETLEIAELSYRVEPWSAQTERLFGPKPPSCNCGDASLRLPSSWLGYGDASRAEQKFASAQSFFLQQHSFVDGHLAYAQPEELSPRRRLWQSG